MLAMNIIVVTYFVFFLCISSTYNYAIPTGAAPAATIASSLPSTFLERIVFGSCNNPIHGGQIWDLIKSKDPQRLILLGDNVYADRKKSIMVGHFEAATPARIQRMYNMLKGDPSFQGLLSHLGGFAKGAVNAIYDDHDYGVNDADKTYPYRNQSMALFWDFMEVAKSSPKREQEGVYSSQTIQVKLPAAANSDSITSSSENDFVYKVVMLDSRSNRDTKLKKDCDFLGSNQWEWLEEELLQQPFPDLILLGSSIQVLPTDKFVEEVWDECPRSRSRLLHLVKIASRYTNIILLSGDVHSAEILQANLEFHHTHHDDAMHHSRSNNNNNNNNNNSSSSSATDSEKLVKAVLDTDSPYHLYELTSSGLTHTINRIIDENIYNSSANTTTYEYKNKEIKTIPRNPIVGYLYNLYQAIGTHHYRVDRFYDHYQGVNFGAIEIYRKESGVGVEDGFYLSVDIFSHEGKVVMNKRIPLKSHRKRVISENEDSVRSEIIAMKKLDVSDVPKSGPILRWRTLMFRGIISLILLLVIVIPALVAIWFLVVSVMYLFYTREMDRRDNLTKIYKEKKNN